MLRGSQSGIAATDESDRSKQRAVDQRPSEETSETGQDDPDNEQNDDEGDWDNKVARVKAIIRDSLRRIK